MIEVTDRAMDQLARMRTQAGLAPDQGLGFVPQGDGGMQLAPVQAGPTDQVITHEDQPVMVVPAALADTLDGLVLDCQIAAGETQFTLSRTDDGANGARPGAAT